MGGGGSVQNMRNTLNSNDGIVRKKPNSFRKKWGFAALRDQYRAGEGKFEFQPASPEEYAAIRARIMQERKTEKKLVRILIGTLLLALGAIIFFVIQANQT